MQTYYKDKFVEMYNTDCMQILKELPSESVQMCVTSPPYYNLRDYNIDGQIGLEETPKEYVEKLVQVFNEVKRVLKNNGLLWLNLGDSYARQSGKEKAQGFSDNNPYDCTESHKPPDGMKPKDLMGIPWMVAFALRNDGWYLRQDIIWSKPNPMPESVQDRCTKSHEYIFLLSKSKSYFYDNDAVKEPALYTERWGTHTKIYDEKQKDGLDSNNSEFKNKRSVWNINTQSYKEAHFATFPIEIPEICIRAGSKEGDIVLDPFNGAGTTGVACIKWKRCYIGIELNPEYAGISKKRFVESVDRYSSPLLDLIDENKKESEV